MLTKTEDERIHLKTVFGIIIKKPFVKSVNNNNITVFLLPTFMQMKTLQDIIILIKWSNILGFRFSIFPEVWLRKGGFPFCFSRLLNSIMF